MKDFSKMPDNTRLRVKVPKALYESIKTELEKKNIKENLDVNEAGAPDPVDALTSNPAFSMAARSITGPEANQRFNKLMDAVWNSIPAGGKPAALTALVTYAKNKGKAPSGPTGATVKKDLGAPPKVTNPNFPGISTGKGKPETFEGEMEESSVEEGQLQEANVEQQLMDALPYLAGLLASGIGVAYLKDTLATMKAKGLKGAQGLKQAAKEVGQSASSQIQRSKGM